MQRSLYTAVSGVKVHQTYLDVTGHNISNVNTVGYKRDVVQFADMISQTIRNEAAPVSPPGGINPAQVGLGARVASIDACFSQGSLQNTELPTDMAIMGEGFFIVNNGGRQLYTRAGNFALDKDGNLVMQGNGYLVQGFKFDGASQQSSPSDIVIPVGDRMEGRATTLAAFRCNLDSRSAARISDPATVTTVPAGSRPFQVTGPSDLYASASSVSNKSAVDAFGQDMMGSYDWKDSFVVYDGDGNSHTMNVLFRKAVDKPADTASNPPVSAESEWDWYAYYSDEKGQPVAAYGQGAGTVVFGDDGVLKRTYALNPAAGWSAAEKNISAANDGVPTGLVEANFTSGGNTITLDFLGADYASQNGLPFNGAMDAVTNFGSPMTTKMKAQNGYTSGVLNNWGVSENGTITGIYTNGKTRPISQVALARFINPQGLNKVGNTCFEETADSGKARTLKPGEDGAGIIKGLHTEMSNVDLAEEFVNLIRSQRGLQINTRAVTTSDQMLEVLINLKR